MYFIVHRLCMNAPAVDVDTFSEPETVDSL